MFRVFLANLILWRSVRKFMLERDRPDLPPDSVLSRDIRRFLRLSDDFVVLDSGRDNVLIDIRYSMLPTGITPMWGIDLNLASASQHAKFTNYRDRPENAREMFVSMLLGRDLPD